MKEQIRKICVGDMSGKQILWELVKQILMLSFLAWGFVAVISWL